MAVLYEYIVSGPVSSSLSHPSVAHQCIACTITLSSSNNQATAHPTGSTSHEAVNTSPHAHCKAAIHFLLSFENALQTTPTQAPPSRCTPRCVPRRAATGHTRADSALAYRHATQVPTAVAPWQNKSEPHVKHRWPPSLMTSRLSTCSSR